MVCFRYEENKELQNKKERFAAYVIVVLVVAKCGRKQLSSWLGFKEEEKKYLLVNWHNNYT